MYRITINGNRPAEDIKEYASEGETVEIKMPAMTDVSVYVTSDKVPVVYDRHENGWLYYVFTMPASDVDVKIETVSTMMYRGEKPLFGGDMPSMSEFRKPKKFCDVCGTPLNDEQRFCTECGARVVRTPKFCSECGTPVKEGQRFCTECGAKLV